MSKGSSERNLLAERLRSVRAADRKSAYIFNRSGSQYLHCFNGLENYFKLISMLESNVVLDIGAGNRVGITELSLLPIAENLEFWATVLTKTNAGVPRRLDTEMVRTFITSVETLRGIPSRSVGGVLALNSIAYCMDPYTAVYSMDRVLTQGGVVKAFFWKDGPKEEADLGFRAHTDFMEVFKEFGYDVVSDDSQILLALKPGGPKIDTAQELLMKDRRDYINSRASHSVVKYLPDGGMVMIPLR